MIFRILPDAEDRGNEDTGEIVDKQTLVKANRLYDAHIESIVIATHEAPWCAMRPADCRALRAMTIGSQVRFARPVLPPGHLKSSRSLTTMPADTIIHSLPFASVAILGASARGPGRGFIFSFIHMRPGVLLFPFLNDGKRVDSGFAMYIGSIGGELPNRGISPRGGRLDAGGVS
ncbi:MAG: hypothetical protein LBP86_07815 [Azoarcus sp.]|jgi:hypothetical protein|nr:hypothetical protein [Azoarcus sp.]